MPQQWIDPYAGFRYTPETVSVTREHQRDKLTACGIRPDVFGDDVDPAFFIGLAIHAGINSGITAEGNINMLQSLTVYRPAMLDEELSVTGMIRDVQPVPRGRTLHSQVSFSDADGRLVIQANRVSLKPDPDRQISRGAGDKPAPLVKDAAKLKRTATYQLTPEGVKAYSSEGNSIHYEEAAAARAGFRAPLIGGGMGVHFLMAHLWGLHASQRPRAFSAEIYFRRPIFWDEAVVVAVDEGEVPGLMALLKPDGKVGTELALHPIMST
ncbi:MAG: hypothetical protein ACFHXK_11160 [bacterium]